MKIREIGSFLKGSILIRVVIVILICIISNLLMLNVIHNHKLEDEIAVLEKERIGNFVEVNDHKMNVYTEGDGDVKLLFMSGANTPSPILDFKALYEELSDTYQVIVVEKSGYGFSEVSGSSRDIDTILYEYRMALELSNIDGPFVLVPHSMSGIEAQYWAQQYPEEVSAIIGLDMAIPEYYESMKTGSTVFISKMISKVLNFGFVRVIPLKWVMPIFDLDALSNEDLKLYKKIVYSRTMTEDMLNEVANIKESSEKVSTDVDIDIPMLMFVSNGKGTGFKKEEWRAMQSSYATSHSAILITLEAQHYIHNFEYETIAAEIDGFLNELNQI